MEVFFKCLHCNDVYLCEKCESFHPRTHLMAKVSTPFHWSQPNITLAPAHAIHTRICSVCASSFGEVIYQRDRWNMNTPNSGRLLFLTMNCMMQNNAETIRGGSHVMGKVPNALESALESTGYAWHVHAADSAPESLCPALLQRILLLEWLGSCVHILLKIHINSPCSQRNEHDMTHPLLKTSNYMSQFSRDVIWGTSAISCNVIQCLLTQKCTGTSPSFTMSADSGRSIFVMTCQHLRSALVLLCLSGGILLRISLLCI
ncbi:hypothetical protein Pelo_17346 [Pelomyxa schiedti]|nr:hypothetical protein Pelo_17346 [Pelomyxa schiedti]